MILHLCRCPPWLDGCDTPIAQPLVFSFKSKTSISGELLNRMSVCRIGIRHLTQFLSEVFVILGFIRVIDIPFSSQMPPLSNVKCHPLSVGGNRETPSTLDRKRKVDTKQIFPVFLGGKISEKSYKTQQTISRCIFCFLWILMFSRKWLIE